MTASTTTDAGGKCEHTSCVPAWDAEKARSMDSYEVRKHFPRFMGNCPDCGQQVIVYASLEQYVAGDY